MTGDTSTHQQQEDDASLEFDEHVPGRASKLEPHRVAIAKMRERRWPYRKITKWLADERRLTVNPDTVRAFCLVRDITKGAGSKSTPRANTKKVAPVRASQPAQTSQGEDEDEEFDFDDTKPLETWKSRGGTPPPR